MRDGESQRPHHARPSRTSSAHRNRSWSASGTRPGRRHRRPGRRRCCSRSPFLEALLDRRGPSDSRTRRATSIASRSARSVDRGRAGARCGYDADVLTPEILGRTFAEAPDPELARVAFSRVGEDAHAREVLGRPEVLPVASRLLGFSTAASDLLVRHPEEVDALGDVRARTDAELAQELADDCTTHGTTAGLRRFRRRAMLRIAARDLAGAPFEEVVAEVSDVADACLAHACPDGLRDRRAGQARRLRAQLRERRRPPAPASRGRRRGHRRDDSGQPDRRPLRPHVRGRGPPRRPHAPARWPGRSARAQPPGHARLLRARGRHLGTPGDDQGASRGGRPGARRGVRRRRRRVRLPARTSTRPRSTTFGVRRFGSRSTCGVAARSSSR